MKNITLQNYFLQTLLERTARLGAHWATLLLVATTGPNRALCFCVLSNGVGVGVSRCSITVRQDGMGCVLPGHLPSKSLFFKFRPSCRNKLTPIQIRANSHQSQTQAYLTNKLLPKALHWLNYLKTVFHTSLPFAPLANWGDNNL